jgi:hypothetical protein
MPIELRDRRFIVDSGNGHDLISVEKVERMDLNPYESNKISVHTANGVTSTRWMVDLDFDTFNEPAEAHVLEDTPSVLSLGKRYMEQGYSFALPSGRDPYMINPTGEKVKMEVRDLIPYVYLCDEEYRPTTGKEAKMVAKILGLMKDNVNRTIYIDGLSGGEVSESCDETSTSFGEEAERRGRRRGGDVSGRSSWRSRRRRR